MKESEKYLKKIYETISTTPRKYGKYHKTVFHVHTPCSYDYCLLKEWSEQKFRECEESELYNLCKEKNVIPCEVDLRMVNFENDYAQIYKDRKEWYSFLLLSNEIYKNDIEIVLVSDHNNIDGIIKLEKAINDLKKFNLSKDYPEVISGVEISCADKLHVVVMFQPLQKDEVKKWLEENLINEKEGTYKTSLDVISTFRSFQCVPYIAHLNSADLFKEKRFLSSAYRTKLRDMGCFEYIGVHNIEQIPDVTKRLEDNRIKNSKIVIDNDSHNIEGLKDNYFWIKSGKRNYDSIYEALTDFEVSVSYHVKADGKTYISGMYVEYEPDGFLSDKNGEDPFILRFSDSLNCFIGGRGTGKSTVLQILDYSLGIRVDNERILDFLCKHGNVWILFCEKDKEYLIKMGMPIKEYSNEHILRSFGKNKENLYYYRYFFNEQIVHEYACKHYLSVYEVKNRNSGLKFETVKNKLRIIECLYDTRYSVNKLVQVASGQEINAFIMKLIFQNRVLSDPTKIVNVRSKQGLIRILSNVQSVLKQRKDEVETVLSSFNKNQKGILQIEYSQNEVLPEPEISKWIFGRNAQNVNYGEYAITEENVVQYLFYVYDDVGIFELLKLALDKRYSSKRALYEIGDFLNSGKAVEDDINIKNAIFDSLVTQENIYEILDYLKTTLKHMEKFSLLFNVNSKEGSNLKENYMNVLNLSLGQKVVAMLDLILGYGEYVGDYRPILIDQPEDNLDSQYIYKNLVRQLREIKDKRQIIIATHNATIVTNSMTDQVCVMNSDGKHGWIEKTGYPSEIAIKKKILNYLEGGVESFKHKMKIYESVLNE